jgi:protein-histidine N-methyltransferase
MRAACNCPVQPEGDLDEVTQHKLSFYADSPISSNQLHPYLCLVAAKVLYFGVGGSVSEFVQTVEDSPGLEKGNVETVWEKKAGVGRRVMRIHWDKK